MGKKKIISLLLLLFAVAGIVYAVIGAATNREVSGKSERGSSAETKKDTLPPDGVTVYYFHTTFRCHSCLLIEQRTKRAVEENFAADLKNGTVRLREINYEEPRNQHYMDRYKLYTKQVILSAVKGGKEVAWKNLDGVWQLLRDEMRFSLYITDEIKKFRAENGL